MSKNLPKMINPMQSLMMADMPGLPEIIGNAMPVVMPQMAYNTNPLAMMGGNWKRKRIEKATEMEARIAENANRALQAKLNSMITVITFSSRVSCELAEHDHKKTMFQLEEQEKQMDIFIKQAQAQQAGFEAKLSELDFQIREAQMKKILNDDVTDI